MNRRLTTQLASLHLAPTPRNRRNLLHEGIDRSSIVVTGNTVIDALLWAARQDGGFGDPSLSFLGQEMRPVLLVTAHRRESWGPAMGSIARALRRIAEGEPDLTIVLPAHRNPVVREVLVTELHRLPNVVIVEPLEYGAFARLMKRAHIILTDSGGIQEEGPSLGKPVLVMRETTERPEAIEAGTAALVGTDEQVIFDRVSELMHDADAYAAMANAVNPYGDGAATGRVVAALANFLGLGPPAHEFDPAVIVDGAGLRKALPR
jgi:UDP-N-acetylglucosamine 2-epimerase (non-hydrolysing)